jgi:hypothetical protein
MEIRPVNGSDRPEMYSQPENDDSVCSSARAKCLHPPAISMYCIVLLAMTSRCKYEPDQHACPHPVYPDRRTHYRTNDIRHRPHLSLLPDPKSNPHARCIDRLSNSQRHQRPLPNMHVIMPVSDMAHLSASSTISAHAVALLT